MVYFLTPKAGLRTKVVVILWFAFWISGVLCIWYFFEKMPIWLIVLSSIILSVVAPSIQETAAVIFNKRK